MPSEDVKNRPEFIAARERKTSALWDGIRNANGAQELTDALYENDFHWSEFLRIVEEDAENVTKGTHGHS